MISFEYLCQKQVKTTKLMKTTLHLFHRQTSTQSHFYLAVGDHYNPQNSVFYTIQSIFRHPIASLHCDDTVDKLRSYSAPSQYKQFKILLVSKVISVCHSFPSTDRVCAPTIFSTKRLGAPFCNFRMCVAISRLSVCVIPQFCNVMRVYFTTSYFSHAAISRLQTCRLGTLRT